jgi:hypothetical protein
MNGQLVSDVKWKWPATTDQDWEPRSENPEGPSAEGISKLMVHLWTSKEKHKHTGHAQKSLNKKDNSSLTNKKYRLPKIQICGPSTVETLPVEEYRGSVLESHWINRFGSIRIYFPEQNAMEGENSFRVIRCFRLLT